MEVIRKQNQLTLNLDDNENEIVDWVYFIYGDGFFKAAFEKLLIQRRAQKEDTDLRELNTTIKAVGKEISEVSISLKVDEIIKKTLDGVIEHD